MRTELIIGFTVDGFHCWPDAPDKYIEFRTRHRHLFKITCFVPTSEGEYNNPTRREIEFWEHTRTIQEWIKTRFGSPAEFSSLSCEGIADTLLRAFHCTKVFVGEEDNLGAIVYG